MHRREILQALSLMMGNMVLSPAVARVLDGYEPKISSKTIFKKPEIALLGEIAETIIPQTTSPGAKAAGVGEFIKLMIDDCYKPDEQTAFRAGLSEVDKQANGLFKKNFVDCDKKQKVDVLQRIEAQAMADRSQGKKMFSFWFTLKELTLTGYFTSEIGAKQALEYVYIPAKYDPCMEIKPEQKAWALS
jgi:hypothetical protein